MMNEQQLTGLTDSHLDKVQTPFQSLLVNKDVSQDLINLVVAADKAGFQLEVASGFRDFYRQKNIWNRKFSGQAVLLDSDGQALDYKTLSQEEILFAILRWSALPSASRHHWGTDFDVYAKNLLPDNTNLMLEPWEYWRGHQAPFYSWLKDNVTAFGFFFPYQQDLGGVAPEPWHISHYASSKQFADQLSLELIQKTLIEQDVLGLSVITAHLERIYSGYVKKINLSLE